VKSFDELHAALQQMIDGKNTMNVPARENEDADLILATGIKEHKEMTELLAMCCKDLYSASGKFKKKTALELYKYVNANNIAT